jgi:hypothetical protein
MNLIGMNEVDDNENDDQGNDSPLFLGHSQGMQHTHVNFSNNRNDETANSIPIVQMIQGN